jgi:two-component system chemotaxis response regulator CheB
MAPSKTTTPATQKLRVLIVDDSAVMRRVISETLSGDPAFEVVGLARNGKDGLNQALELQPDVITLDIEMPEMNGLDALRAIRLKGHAFNPAILMCSSLTVAGSEEALRALRLGASEIIAKPADSKPGTVDAFKDELCRKARAIGDGHASRRRGAKQPETTPDAPPPRIRTDRIDAVVIASSTGGPPVLETAIGGIADTLRVPIIIAQHMPAMFTRTLASRLDQIASVPVLHVEKRTLLLPGRVYVASGGTHLHLKSERNNSVSADLSEGSQLQLVTFEVARTREEFAVDILAVQRDQPDDGAHPRPASPAAVEGVINLRGKIIPVLDLRKRFG